jgi:hypothetical protein
MMFNESDISVGKGQPVLRHDRSLRRTTSGGNKTLDELQVIPHRGIVEMSPRGAESRFTSPDEFPHEVRSEMKELLTKHYPKAGELALRLYNAGMDALSNPFHVIDRTEETPIYEEVVTSLGPLTPSL